MDNESKDDFIYAVTIEYEGQEENILGKFKYDANAFLVARYVMNSLQKTPILRVLNMETKEVLGSYRREIVELEKTTSVFL